MNKTMVHLFHSINSRARCLLGALTLLLLCIPAVAQQATVSAPLSADEVMRRVVDRNELRSKALENYSSIRSYHLECHGLIHKKADMVVRADYHSPNKKEFTILSEEGSGTVRHKVFKRLLEEEQESMQDDNQQRSAITPENYHFEIANYEKTSSGEFYVLEAQPRKKHKFLFQGRIWVDAADFAITRIEGQPAVNPSWWTEKTDFKRSYQKLGEFWLPQSNQSETKVRIFGTAILTIEYRDYQITEAPGSKPVPSSEDSSNGH